jgi:XTP/dITP diphosphohydrolase
VNRTPFLLATRSAGKLRELRQLFDRAGIYVIDLAQAGITEATDEDAIESWDTFEENALAKAQYFQRRSGLPTFADDSGLAVDALRGRPGVLSKRFSGRTDLTGAALDAANNAALHADLRRNASIPSPAAFVCAAAYADEMDAVVRTGRTTGMIISEPRGTHGFGYDPHFLSDELGITFGEAPTEAKSTVSHRARAFAALLDALRQMPRDPLHQPGRLG